MEYYCTYQSFGNNVRQPNVIFGIGKTVLGAQRDAREQVCPHENIEDMFTSKCTKRLYDYVKKYGGDGDFVYENDEVDLDIKEMKGFKTATYGKKPHRDNITQLENSVRRMF